MQWWSCCEELLSEPWLIWIRWHLAELTQNSSNLTFLLFLWTHFSQNLQKIFNIEHTKRFPIYAIYTAAKLSQTVLHFPWISNAVSVTYIQRRECNMCRSMFWGPCLEWLCTAMWRFLAAERRLWSRNDFNISRSAFSRAGLPFCFLYSNFMVTPLAESQQVETKSSLAPRFFRVAFYWVSFMSPKVTHDVRPLRSSTGIKPPEHTNMRMSRKC